MQKNDFFKFPSTPHVLSNGTIRGEKIVDNNSLNKLLLSTVYVEEKIDGANLGISFNDNGEQLIQNRGHLITWPFSGQWRKMPEWISSNENLLFEVLENKYILFGEWCYAKHTVFYDKLPNLFIPFDVFDKNEGKFLSVDCRNVLLNRLNLPIIPLIYHGKITLLDIPNFMHQSAYSSDFCEGLYFRVDSGGWLEIRAKYVRDNFIQVSEQHWSQKSLILNKVVY